MKILYRRELHKTTPTNFLYHVRLTYWLPLQELWAWLYLKEKGIQIGSPPEEQGNRGDHHAADWLKESIAYKCLFMIVVDMLLCVKGPRVKDTSEMSEVQRVHGLTRRSFNEKRIVWKKECGHFTREEKSAQTGCKSAVFTWSLECENTHNAAHIWWSAPSLQRWLHI